MRPLSDVLALPVRLNGIQLGRPTDVLVDATVDRVLGFEVMCGDETERFLPFAVARIGPDEIALESALTLIDEGDLDFYRRRSRRLSELGYADPWLDDGGALRAA
ncbi:MAG TPA: hypothetical protein VFI04_07450 [Gaiellaceae bacterium]|jgi:hypothetical protein|nr:hypothetical protein [Gaiellaceae bacterium]